jgi:O-methyltransferase
MADRPTTAARPPVPLPLEGPDATIDLRDGGTELTPAQRYLDLLKGTLSRSLFDASYVPVVPKSRRKRRFYAPVARVLAQRGLTLARRTVVPGTFAVSPPLPVLDADTLIGPVGLGNIQRCVEAVLRDDVPGDLIETGVWRGGSVVFMRAVLAAHGDSARTVWVADSFQGLPTVDVERHAGDAGDDFWAEQDWLAVSQADVERLFERYGLLDDQVRFLPGWFHETLPGAPIARLALIRLDGDMYGSTMDALRALYPRLSVGGYVIVDDYWLPRCRAAVDEYRAEHGITDPLVSVDRAIAFWRRSA